jgi:ATP/maltotriose-dependent transcriptional regulator MalT/DNA-binding SARP family transcriptional activator
MGDFLPITRTKIVVPRRRAELFSRTRLLGLLDDLLDNQLIILAAPAGYGKTSLLVDFAHLTQWPMCWYSLDTLDQDPQRFITHFVSAISQRFPAFGKTCMAALQSMGQDRLDLDVLVSLIINDAYDNITEHFILVVDDFHLVENSQGVVYFVNRFLQDIDENCHVVLASRSLLTLPDLPLMVARSQVGGLSFEELCFQPVEIQELLRQNYQLALSEAEATELARDTEGWVTGLLLSTQVMGKTIANRLRVARVSGVGLYEYLAQQVLAQQSEAVQDFLLRSSLLDEFDARLCKQVIGRALNIQPAWRELMDSVLRHNLFVLPVGEDGSFLRYHHLFQDFLRERFRRERPEEARQVFQRMAEVYAEHSDWERTYAIFRELGDLEAIAHLIGQAGSMMMANGRMVTLSEWFDSIPTELLNRYPGLISIQGAVAVARGDYHKALQLFDQAVVEQRKASDWWNLADTLCRRSVAYRLLGRYRDALNDAEETLSRLEEESYSRVAYADALVSKGNALVSLGQPNDALTLFQQALVAYQAMIDESSAAKVWMEVGRVSRTLGKYSEAEAAFIKALEYYQATNNLSWQANLYNSLGILQHARSDYSTATSSFEKAIHYAKISGSPRLEAYALTSIGDLYQELDAVQEALEAYRQARLISQQIRDGYLVYYLNLVEARLKQSQADPARTQELLQAAQKMAEERGSLYEQNLCLLEWGRLKIGQEQYSQALADFGKALAFFIQESYQVETPRARLYVFLAALLSRQSQDAALQMEELWPFLEEIEKRKLLVAAGQEMKMYLEQLKNNVQLKDINGDGFVSALLSQIDQYEQNIPAQRRLIRRQAVVVPFAPPKMLIRSLGRIQVKVSDHLVTGSEWQVQTARDLFFLLLAHPEGLTKEEIGEIFWPDSSPAELKLRFKNTIYRLRHAAGKDVILFEGERLYLFNRGMDYEYDAETFIKETSLAEKAVNRELKIQHYLNALKFYKGPFLPDLDETWAAIERERLQQIYMDVLLRLANIYVEVHQYESALTYCQRALNDDPCQEGAHRIAMRIYAELGNRALVIRQYEQCRQALISEVDAPPSPQTQMLYETLIQ